MDVLESLLSYSMWMVDTMLHSLPASELPQFLLFYLSQKLSMMVAMQEMQEMQEMKSVQMPRFPE